MTASTMIPNSANSKTTQNEVESGARVRAISRSDSASGISVYQFQRFDQARVAHGKERGFADDAQINKGERRAHADERNKIPKAEMHAGAVQRGKNDDVHVERLHADNLARHPTELMRMFLNRLQKQNRKRPEKATDDEQHAQGPPAFRITGQKVLRLFRNVGIPDEHVLAETDVGPENGEGQHPLSHDVVMLDRDDVFQVTGPPQCGDDENQQRHRPAGCAGKNVNAPHGGKPFVVQTHQPVARAESETEREQRQTDKGDFAEQKCEARVAVLVLQHRETAKQLCRDDKEYEKENAADEKEVPVKISALGIKDRIVASRSVHPFIEVMSKEQHRDKEQRHDAEKDGDVFQLAPHRDRPIRIGGVMDQRPKETAGAECKEKG